MRIQCPCCGERSLDEFNYHGDASVVRPNAFAPTAMSDFLAYVYERDNRDGDHRELWYHAAGCHAWLVVTRNVRSHIISDVRIARGVARERDAAAQTGSIS